MNFGEWGETHSSAPSSWWEFSKEMGQSWKGLSAKGSSRCTATEERIRTVCFGSRLCFRLCKLDNDKR